MDCGCEEIFAQPPTQIHQKMDLVHINFLEYCPSMAISFFMSSFLIQLQLRDKHYSRPQKSILIAMDIFAN